MMESSSQSPVLDVWSLAKELQKKQTQSSFSQKTLIVVGDRSSAKTSFIKVLKSQNDSDTKPTCAIDYTFVRKTGVKKQIINCYQVASRNLRSVIGESLLTKENFKNLHFVISIDLGQPADIIDSTLAWIQIIREESEKFLQSVDPEIISKFQQFRRTAVLQHQDGSNIRALPLPTVLLMNKYDLYEKYETEVRKWISRTIRYLAHTNGCSVFTNSIKSAALSAQVRSIFHTFTSNDSSFNQKDHLKPIFISFGNDSIGSMSLPHTGSMKMEDALKKQIQGLVGVKAQKNTDEFDFSKYREERIDQLIAQKERELDVLVKKNRAKAHENGMVDGSPHKRFA